MTALPARGEIWWCELPEAGRRPVVVLSRDAAIPRLRRAWSGPAASVVNLDSVESVSIGTLVERLGRLGDDRMRQVCDALAVAVACED